MGLWAFGHKTRADDANCSLEQGKITARLRMTKRQVCDAKCTREEALNEPWCRVGRLVTDEGIHPVTVQVVRRSFSALLRRMSAALRLLRLRPRDIYVSRIRLTASTALPWVAETKIWFPDLAMHHIEVSKAWWYRLGLLRSQGWGLGLSQDLDKPNPLNTPQLSVCVGIT